MSFQIRLDTIKNNKLLDTIRQQAADSVTLEIQGLVYSFFKEYEVHGEEDLYLDYFQDFKKKIIDKISDIEDVIEPDKYYTLSNKQPILSKLGEFTARIRKETKSLSRSSTQEDVYRAVTTNDLIYHDRIPLRVIH